MSFKNFMTKGRLAVIIIVAILLIDQIIKVWVKTHMSLHESIHVTNWFYIAFIENNGMAYGMQIGSKLLLSLFRIVAIGILIYYVRVQTKRNARTGYIVCLSMILAGAIGNLIDCMFYGLVFDSSTPYSISNFVTLGDGYAPFLMGKVVDMFYFPFIVTNYPDWFPFWAGEEFIFFSPVFNFADAAISIGVVMLLLFFRNEIDISFKGKDESRNVNSSE